MWCPTCEADVAAELSADQRRLLCARCHTELALSATEPMRGGGVRMSGVEHSARDLLARWSADTLLEAPKPDATLKLAEIGWTAPAKNIPDPMPVDIHLDCEPRTIHRKKRRPKPSKVSVVRPAFDINAIAQLMAYGGIAGMSYGAALILWGHFGGPVNYAPTGWLLTTVGQMLLFLGLVTLVFNSIERMNHRLMEMEQDRGRRRRKRLKADAGNGSERLSRAA